MAYGIFLRPRSIGPIPELDREAAPPVTLLVVGIVGLAFAAALAAYALGVTLSALSG